jgi:hypothetical protein
MGTIEFLRAILPRNGYYVIAAQHPVNGRVRHEAFDTVEAAAECALTYDQKGWTVYHACCTVEDPAGTVVVRKGRERRSIRNTENAKAVRSQWLDIDVGEGKDFPTRKDALTALKALCKHFKIPAPLIVSSGRGLHCYWIFADEVPAREFKHKARHFSEAIKGWGFPHDTKPTRNVVTLLRPVGTHHRKTATPLPVKVVHKSYAKGLDSDKFYNSFGELGPDRPAHLLLREAEVLAQWGAAPVYAPSDPKRVAKACPALREFALHKQDDPPLHEDHWRNMLGILKHCEGGEKLAHKWSKQSDKRYDHGETQNKLEGWQGGPPLCETVRANCALCETCPHVEKGRSPTSFGKSPDLPPEPAVEEQPIVVVPHSGHNSFHSQIPTKKNNPIPFWPRKYSWDGSFLRVWVASDDDSGEWVPFSATLYYPYMRYQKDDGTRAALICVLINPALNQWKLFELDTGKVSDQRSLAVELAGHEILYMKQQQPLNQQFVQDILHGIRAAGLESKTYSSFGWHDDGFVIGEKMITADGERPVFLSKRVPSELRNGFGQKGTIEGWRAGVDFVYNRPGAEVYQLAICIAAAAPLVKLCLSDNYHGGPLALTGESGTGKTIVGLVGASIFGPPRTFLLVANADGTTTNALIQRISTYGNLPVVMDEITGRTSQEMAALMFALSNGKPKRRLKSDGSEIDFGDAWATTSIITGNTNMTGMMSEADRHRADASQVRVLEVRNSRQASAPVFSGVNGKRDIEQAILSENYGVVGDKYLRTVVRNKDKISKLLQRLRHEFVDLSDDPSERFQYDLVACALVAGHLLKEIGAVSFNLSNLKRWALKQITVAREERRRVQMSAEDYLQEFIAYLTHRTITTISYDPDARKPAIESVMEPRFDPCARHATGDKQFVVVRSALVDWCRNHSQKLDADWLLEQLAADGYIKSSGKGERHRITKGTDLKGVRARCIEFNYDRLGDLDLPTNPTP